MWLILCLPLAFVVSQFKIAWFFPAMLLVIAGRYTVFATMFGSRLYWACAAALATGAYLLVRLAAGPAIGAFTGATIEAAFSAVIFSQSRWRTAARTPAVFASRSTSANGTPRERI